MDIEELGKVVAEIRTDGKETRKSTEENTRNIAVLTEAYKTLKSVNDLVPMLIRWVFCPLVLALGVSAGASKVISQLMGGS